MKHKNIFIICMIILVLLFLGATMFSIYKFSVINPIASCTSMLKILYTDAGYIEVQNFPKKVIFAKPENTMQNLLLYMRSRGFEESTSNQALGGNVIFTNGKQNEEISISTNKYYSKWIWQNTWENENLLTGVIVKVTENTIFVMDSKHSLYTIKNNYSNEFKVNQEIEIKFDGTVLETFPAQLGSVESIDIISENSNIEIPNSILTYCYSSKDNVTVNVTSLSTDGITLEITDSNEIKYNYASSYTLSKYVKNESYKEMVNNIPEVSATTNSTPSFEGTGAEYEWKELLRIVSTNEDEAYTENGVIIRKFRFTNAYPNLSEGEYLLTMSGNDTARINVYFNINANGKAEFIKSSIND